MVKRNLVAHNGPMVDVYFHEVTGKVCVDRKLRSERDQSKEVTISELDDLLHRTRSLASELADLLYQLQLPENRMVREKR
jgi:hypothetical protein